MLNSTCPLKVQQLRTRTIAYILLKALHHCLCSLQHALWKFRSPRGWAHLSRLSFWTLAVTHWDPEPGGPLGVAYDNNIDINNHNVVIVLLSIMMILMIITNKWIITIWLLLLLLLSSYRRTTWPLIGPSGLLVPVQDSHCIWGLHLDGVMPRKQETTNLAALDCPSVRCHTPGKISG